MHAGIGSKSFDVRIARRRRPASAGRLDTKTETLGGTSRSERYTYDDAGRLGQVFVDGASTPTHEYAYDPNGNRDDGTHDAQDRLLTHGGFSFAYGANGELAKKTDGVTLAETLYAYDTHGSLRAVTRPAPLAPIEYVIDGNNRRIGKKVGGSLVQGFLYDGARVVAELDAAGAVVARFVYATDGHAPDLMLKGGATYRFVKDHLGSPRLVVDAATGAVAQRIDFDPWGVVTLDSNPSFQPFGFAGGLWDRDTGFVRFGARDYDPATGRWTSKDSIRFAGGLNLYGYVDNDPINFVDPTGQKPWGAESWPPRPSPPARPCLDDGIKGVGAAIVNHLNSACRHAVLPSKTPSTSRPLYHCLSDVLRRRRGQC
ncbi:MAG: RHS repeat-associated core domain-containing protein [Labilithrix sp.]|nr:RHS repeat-associated core domain-containing protein [Labilithrix sp.]